ncbi:hypothetical protein UlMin_003446, partial [Ulmus minor]
GMGIPVGKLSLYTCLGGLCPSGCFPVTIDISTNNQKLLDDEVYIGFRHKRATGQEYADLLDEFMSAIRQNYQRNLKILQITMRLSFCQNTSQATLSLMMIS